MTTMKYVKNYLQGTGMTTVHISLDMQLYMVAVQVKWSDLERWKAMIVHPGGMHTLMSILGCIWKLMKGSELDDLLRAAYRGLAGILSGKSWSRAMRALRTVCVTMLNEYLSEDRSHTFEDLADYLVGGSENANWTAVGGLSHKANFHSTHIH